MDDKKRLPDAELAVMQAIWAVGGEVSRGDLVARQLRRGAERRAAARAERDRRAAAVFGRYEPLNGDKKEDAPWKHFC